MGKIQELSEQLANKIAAGEVVERPMSVVKELVENSIDAGSTEISVFLEESGMRSIQIVDNGEGILRDEVALAFKRHATSKIKDVNDLFRIQTLGFRGEALPSIASVSEVEVETASQQENEGTFLYLKGGLVEKNEPAPLRKGTKITVRNLFYNTPARLKYVRSLQTELSRISDIINRIALSHPEISFRLYHEGQELMRTAGNGDLRASIAGIYGMQTMKKMVEIQGENLDYKVHGYVSLPEMTRSSRNYLSILINGRFIKNFILNKAITSGYGSKLMGGRFPIAVIAIEMDPLLVDVNVHPTKQEVRLSGERELSGLITQAIQTAFSNQRLIPDVSKENTFKKKTLFEPKKEIEQLSFYMTERTADSKPKGKLGFDASRGEFFVRQETSQSEEVPFVLEENVNTQREVGRQEVVSHDFSDREASNPSSFEEESEELQENDTNHPSFDFSDRKKAKGEIEKIYAKLSDEEEIKGFPRLDYFGQMHGTYLFASSEEGLFIVDQHAAQERIKYEYYREEIGKVSNATQTLILPIVLDFPMNDFLVLRDKKDILEEIGLPIEEYGQSSFILRSHPTWFKKGREEKTARELIDMLLVSGDVSVKKYREETAIMMSCKRSIKANHHLNEQQARMLLDDLSRCKNPYNCPHGRPVLVHFTNYEMERMFKRIQDPHESFK